MFPLPPKNEMSTIIALRHRFVAYAQAHPLETRFLCFFGAFVLVWMSAGGIESFAAGFVDGMIDSRH